MHSWKSGDTILDMNKVIRNLSLILLLVALVFSGVFVVAVAEETAGIEEMSAAESAANASIKSYNADVNIKRNNTADCKFNIVMHFDSAVDSLVIPMPDELKGEIRNIKAVNYEYEYDELTNSLKLWDKNRSLEGNCNFGFSYTISGVNNLGEKADHLYLYFVPGSLEYEIPSLKINIKYYDGFEWVSIKSNVAGDKSESNIYGAWKQDKGARTISFSGADIPSYSAVNLHLELPMGAWANATEIGATRDLADTMMLAGILVFIILRIIFRKKEDPVIEACEYPIAEITPAQAGYAIDGIIDNKDFMASMLYLAHNGYLRITEYERRKFKFTYLKEPKNDKHAVTMLMKMLFNNAKLGDTVSLENISGRLRKDMPKFRRAVYHDFNGSFRLLSTASRAANNIALFTFFVVTAMLPLMNYISRGASFENVTDGIVSAVLFAFALTIALIFLCAVYRRNTSRKGDGNYRSLVLAVLVYAVVGIVYIYCNRFAYQGRHTDIITAITTLIFLILTPLMIMGMSRQNKNSSEIVKGTLGLKQFIENADKEEVKQISAKDPDYFFTLLPYAYLFCKSHKLAALFEFTDVDGPDWYIPYGVEYPYTYDIVIFNSMTSNLQKQLDNTVFKPKQD